jgi:septum formation protein
MKIILASGSPRRKELMKKLLDKHNMEFVIEASNVDEDHLKQTISEPNKLVEELSYIKAIDIYNANKDKYDEFIVVGADTIVYFNGKVLGKPKDVEHAVKMLEELNGNMNKVYTGMTVITKKNQDVIIKKTFDVVEVYMKNMSSDDIKWYINTKEPMDKAGAYAIQGIGNKYIEKYVGDFDTIVGLNINELENIIFKEII